MPSGFARSNQFNPWTATANNISQTLLDMPAARQKGYERGQRAGLMQLQGETEQAQADNYRATARKTGIEADIAGQELEGIKMLSEALLALEPQALPDGRMALAPLTPERVAKVNAALAKRSTSSTDAAGSLGKFFETMNAPKENDLARQNATERAKYSADVSAETQRGRPVVANGALYDREGNLLNPGVQRVSQGGSLFMPDETSVGWKAGPSVPGRETTPRSQAIRDQLKATLIKDGLTGTNLSAALNEFDQGGQSPVQMPQRPAQNGYVVGQRYKGGLIYMGGNPNDPQSWQRAQ